MDLAKASIQLGRNGVAVSGGRQAEPPRDTRADQDLPQFADPRRLRVRSVRACIALNSAMV